MKRMSGSYTKEDTIFLNRRILTRRTPLEFEGELSLISSGDLGKAVRRAVTFRVADVLNVTVQSEIQKLFPNRSKDLPTEVIRGDAVDNFKGL